MKVKDLFQELGKMIMEMDHPKDYIDPEEAQHILDLVRYRCTDFHKQPVVITVQLSDGRVDIACNYDKAGRTAYGEVPLPPNVTVEFWDYSDECDSYSQGTKHHTMPENDDHYGQKWTWKPGEVIK